MSVSLPPPWRRWIACLAIPVLAAQTAPPRLAGQAQHPAAAWSASLTAGFATGLRSESFGGGITVSAGVHHGTGPLRIGIIASYANLGSRTTRQAYSTPPPERIPTTLVLRYSQRLASLGLSLELGPRRGSLRPSLLLGFGLYGFDQPFHRVERDSATGVVLDRQSDSGWNRGLGLSAGAALAFPRLGSVGYPRLEARLHGFAVKTTDGWTSLPTLTMGLGMAW